MTAPKNNTPKILKFAAYADKILHEPTEAVIFPLSEEDQQYIRDMQHSIQSAQLKAAGAPFASAAGMAANQWGICKRIFLYCPDGNTEQEPEVVINPSYEPIDPTPSTLPQQTNGWEGCFSIPLATGNIKRHTNIRVSYQNANGDKIMRELTGWHARVWQHENDHLDGFLYDDKRTGKCVEKVQFNSLEELEAFYFARRGRDVE